jgi:hypothetical protein
MPTQFDAVAIGRFLTERPIARAVPAAVRIADGSRHVYRVALEPGRLASMDALDAHQQAEAPRR